MNNIAKLTFLLSLGVAPTLYAAGTTFTEGARDSVTIHPSCKEENTGLTATGVVLPNGPEIKVSIEGADGEEVTSIMSLPYPEALISKNRKGEIFNANPIMGARPSFNQSALFGMDTTTATVPAYGSKGKTEDTKMAFWKLKSVNSYDLTTNTLSSLPYVPEGEFITVELGFSVPNFTAESCLMTMNVRGAQVARCDRYDPDSKTIVAGSEPDIRKKRMRLTVNRDLEKNPLPAHCGKGISVTIEPVDSEVEMLEEKIKEMTP